MIVRFRLPKLDTNMEEATVTAWLRREKETVARGEPLVELTTDKACVEAPAPRSGVLRRIVAPERSVVPVGYVLALIGNPDDPLPDVDAENRRLADAHRRAMNATNATAPAAPNTPAPAAAPPPAPGRVRATPAARRLAREQGVDLALIPPPAANAPIGEEHVRAFIATKDQARS